MEIIDLSLELYEGFQSFPTHPKTMLMDFVTHDFSAPRYIPPCKGYASKLILMSDHAGTHIDAPYHFFKAGKTAESIDLSKTMGRAVLLDASDKALHEEIDAQMLQNIVNRDNLEIKEGDIVLLRSWKGEWGDKEAHELRSLNISGARWLVEQKVKAIGTDLDILEKHISDMTREVHLLLLEKEIPIIENLINLDKLPTKTFQFIGLPLRLRGASGSPIRAVAIIE